MHTILEGAYRNADYGLIRLTLVNITAHAVIRQMEQTEKSSLQHLFEETIRKVLPIGEEAGDRILEQVRNRIFAGKKYRYTG